MKPLFSVVLIARNEETTLPRMLESLEAFKKRGGEVVICDTGSTDNTVSIAREWGAKVEEVGDRFRIYITDEEVEAINNQFVASSEEPILKKGDSLFDFASARNFASSLASNNIISMPDADEVYTALDIDYVNGAINDGLGIGEFMFVFAHDESGEPAISFIQGKTYDKTKMKWTGFVHEVLTSTTDKEVKHIYLPEDKFKIEHWQNESTDRSSYIKGLAYDCYKNMNNDRNCHYFARELMWNGRPKSAIKEFERHLKLGNWGAERAESLIFIGDCTEDVNEKLVWYHKAYQEDPSRRKALLRISSHYYGKNNQACATYASASLQIPPSGFYAEDMREYRELPHELLYCSLGWMCRQDESKFHYDRAIEYAPNNPKYIHDRQYYYNCPVVSILIPTLGRPEGLKKCLESIEKLHYPQDKIEVLVEEDEPRIGVPKRLKSLYGKCHGDLIVYGSNDIEFDPDSILIAVEQFNSNAHIKLLAFNTGEVYPDEGNICEHFMIRRIVVDEDLGGEIFDCDFHHVGVDNLLWEKIKRTGIVRIPVLRCDKAIIKHNHFSRTGVMDEIYELAYSKATEDRELLKQKLTKL